MISFKNTLFIAFMASSIFFLSNCGGKEIFKCGNSKVLGTYKFADTTKSLYSAWTGTESLIFKDSSGNEQEWFSKNGKTVNLKYQAVITVLCDSAILDRQYEYYDSEAHIVEFSNRNPANTNYFRLDLYPQHSGKKDSALVLFNSFTASFSAAGSFRILSPSDKPIPASAQRDYVTSLSNTPRFVADTTMSGKNFKNVYYTTNDFNKSAIYFQKTKMIIGYKEAGKTWLFDRIK
jgi:hypothetical protein